MKAEFLTALRSEDLPGGQQWRLLEPLVYYSAILIRRIELPAGFVADSYSSPNTLFGSWIVRGIDRRPAFIHDKLYAERATTRAVADRVFLEAMEAVGVSSWRRALIYRAVRLGGAFHWPDDPADQPPHDHSGGA